VRRRERVGVSLDHAAVGIRKSARSYVTGIRLDPRDALLVGPAGAVVKCIALRGVVVPLPRSRGSERR
jgi:hypothetical protein